MSEFASKQATIECLENLGFVRNPFNESVFDSPGKNQIDEPVTQAVIYPHTVEGYCVFAGDGFMNPIIADSPESDAIYTKNFTDFLDVYCPGWK